jgi:hypothetical protein
MDVAVVFLVEVLVLVRLIVVNVNANVLIDDTDTPDAKRRVSLSFLVGGGRREKTHYWLLLLLLLLLLESMPLVPTPRRGYYLYSFIVVSSCVD